MCNGQIVILLIWSTLRPPTAGRLCRTLKAERKVLCREARHWQFLPPFAFTKTPALVLRVTADLHCRRQREVLGTSSYRLHGVISLSDYLSSYICRIFVFQSITEQEKELKERNSRTSLRYRVDGILTINLCLEQSYEKWWRRTNAFGEHLSEQDYTRNCQRVSGSTGNEEVTILRLQFDKKIVTGADQLETRESIKRECQSP